MDTTVTQLRGSRCRSVASCRVRRVHDWPVLDGFIGDHGGAYTSALGVVFVRVVDDESAYVRIQRAATL